MKEQSEMVSKGAEALAGGAWISARLVALVGVLITLAVSVVAPKLSWMAFVVSFGSSRVVKGAEGPTLG